MTRTFRHEFFLYGDSPIPGPNVELTVEEIEDAGLREVLQAPDAPFGSWAILDGLLEPTGNYTPFIFREPLGQSREVKVALSGLFGRFVARAYLERYFNLSIFAHVTESRLLLNGSHEIEVVRRGGGDLPDWVACDVSIRNFTIAEAKGSHNLSGPKQALNRAWDQAERIDINIGARRATVKRLAIATRWGMTGERPAAPWISVRDPVDKGDPVTPEEEGAIFVGVVRHHVANTVTRLGHEALADSIRGLSTRVDARSERQAVQRAHRLLETDMLETSPNRIDDNRMDGLLGGIVTRGGPLRIKNSSRAEHEVLARLDLRPVFVGVERRLIQAVIDGDPTAILETLKHREERPDGARSDRAGGWIIPLRGETDDRFCCETRPSSGHTCGVTADRAALRLSKRGSGSDGRCGQPRSMARHNAA